MQDIHINKMPLRALKIVRKGYRKNRSDPQASERLQKINTLIDLKERAITKPKNKISK